MIIMQEKIKNAQAPAENSAPKKSKFKTIDVVYIGVFAALIAVCSWIQIPLTIPITLQTMGVCIASALLGLKRGTFRSEERRVGKECRSRWSPYH